ncbi:acetyltransferase [Acetobacterium woodii DSM 1030]|uniref:Acetyltransferase n=2 Tax=Acetobacterium woodii TaxID=33952 RepID=H6LBB8_ACEWD|nr:acetyltransferase [Acetobacterium woodii DSM 1030]
MLKYIDQKLFNFLQQSKDIMPLRLIKLIAYYYPDARIRKLYFEKIGVYMGEGTFANLGMKITIGELKEKYMIIIGKNVSIAPNVTFITESTPNNSIKLQEIPYVKDKLIKNEKIIINNDVWLGANVTILPGIKIGECSIIGAGSVVVCDVEAYSVYGGVPAKKIRSLEGDESHV